MSEFDRVRSVIILGTENSVALPVVRAAGELMPYARIHTISPGRDKHIAEMSRYVSSRHRLMSEEPGHLLRQIGNMTGDSGETILIPTLEKYVRLAAVHRRKLEQLVRLPVLPEVDRLDEVIDKERLNRLLQDLDLPHARTRPAASVDPRELQADEFPLLLKPKRGFAGVGIVKVSSPGSLAQELARVEADEYIIQEFIPGEDIDCSFLASQGEIQALTIQRVLSGSEFGMSTALRFVTHPATEEYARGLVKRTGYSGLAHLDLRHDERDGKVKLVDFNARVWLTLAASRAAGVDFIRLACLQALGIPLDPPYECQPISYLYGKNSLVWHLRPFQRSQYENGAVVTDLGTRLSDPVPELSRYMRSAVIG